MPYDPKPWCPERVAYARALYQTDLPVREVARRCETSDAQIYIIARRYGWQFRGRNEWPEQRDTILRELWKLGVKTREIGETLGMSKNAVVGRAYRLGLETHPMANVPKQPPEKPPSVAEQMMKLRPGQCRWIEGDPLEDDGTVCGKDAVPGRPYCVEHMERAYRPMRWRDDG